MDAPGKELGDDEEEFLFLFPTSSNGSLSISICSPVTVISSGTGEPKIVSLSSSLPAFVSARFSSAVEDIEPQLAPLFILSWLAFKTKNV